jgi:hypothetical protein
MKRELAAAGLLLLLILTAIWNIRRADALTVQIERNLTRSERAAQYEEFDLARSAADNALALWQSAHNYTSVFLRQPDLDSVSDAFFDLRELLLQEDRTALAAGYERLRYHLEALDWMEHLSPGTLF